MLAHMNEKPGLPTPVGVFRQIFKPTYDEMLYDQIRKVKEKKGEGDLRKLFFDATTWEIK
jgi:2-oxoglutarate ferredoxin oxidoreductase subunit beta